MYNNITTVVAFIYIKKLRIRRKYKNFIPNQRYFTMHTIKKGSILIDNFRNKCDGIMKTLHFWSPDIVRKVFLMYIYHCSKIALVRIKIKDTYLSKSQSITAGKTLITWNIKLKHGNFHLENETMCSGRISASCLALHIRRVFYQNWVRKWQWTIGSKICNQLLITA